MTAQSRGPMLRIGQVAALLATAVLILFDLVTGLWQGAADGPLGSARIVLALVIPAIWLPRYRHDSYQPALLGAAVGCCSLGLTATTMAFGSASGMWGLTELLGLMLVLLVVTRRAEVRSAVVAGEFLVLAIAVEPLRSGVQFEMLFFVFVQTLLAGGVIATGAYLRRVEDGKKRQLALVRAEQRAEFARDLHDFVAHHVTGIVVQAQGARYVADQDPAQAAAALEQIEQAGTEAMTAMRRMVAMLRDDQQDAPLAPPSGLGELDLLTRQFSSAGGPPVQLAVSGSLDGLPVEVTTSAYRVVMEALTNVRQHAAEATEVRVWLRRTPEWLLVGILNNGAGPPRSPGRHGFGLVGLAERVRAAGGWLSAGPTADRRWHVEARLPLSPMERPEER